MVVLVVSYSASWQVLMSNQPKAASSRQPVGQSGTSEYRRGRDVALAYLENIFRALVLHNAAYVHMYGHPAPTPTPTCKHEQQPDPKRITGLTGQGERLAYIGMLLRTAERLREIVLHPSRNFAKMIKELKIYRPDLAHGVAMLQFLTAGLCRNNEKTLTKLRDLIRELASNKSCWLLHNCEAIDLLHIYNETPYNRILTLINKLLDQCRECGNMVKVKKLREELGADLDPSNWYGCADCELMLLDVLLYTRILKIPKINDRMLSSMMLSFSYAIDLRQTSCDQVEAIDEMKKGLEVICSHLSELGLTKVSQRKSVSPNGCFRTESMECEVMFMSGWQEGEKKDTIFHKVIEECERSRLFHIQRRYQQEHAQSGQQKRLRCCEPQMRMCLADVVRKLGNARLALAELVPEHMTLPEMRVSVLLEMDPCSTCKEVMFDINTKLEKLDYFKSEGLKVFSLLPYSHKKYLVSDSPLSISERLLSSCARADICTPIQLKNDLKPFDERHRCMVHGHCRGVRCEGHCQYATPSEALAVRELRCHELTQCCVVRQDYSLSFEWLYIFFHTVRVRGAYA